MEEPLTKIETWINEEKMLGNIFPRGAVLSTVSKDRMGSRHDV